MSQLIAPPQKKTKRAKPNQAKSTRERSSSHFDPNLARWRGSARWIPSPDLHLGSPGSGRGEVRAALVSVTQLSHELRFGGDFTPGAWHRGNTKVWVSGAQHQELSGVCGFCPRKQLLSLIPLACPSLVYSLLSCLAPAVSPIAHIHLYHHVTPLSSALAVIVLSPPLPPLHFYDCDLRP